MESKEKISYEEFVGLGFKEQIKLVANEPEKYGEYELRLARYDGVDYKKIAASTIEALKADGATVETAEKVLDYIKERIRKTKIDV
ncbi:MAG: hypothetical protein IJA40_02920 [Phascolarctobacterium sp.]|nr:hypothetical protein [Phascolarctobacterium sp.]